MAKTRTIISDDLRRDKRPQGSELTKDDVGRVLDYGFGRVLENDVGKRVWLRDGTFSMENDDQRNKRKGPKVGDGATCYIGSDSHACTVIAVSPSGHTVTVQRDKVTRMDTNGMSDCQEYAYEPNPDGETYIATRRRTKHGTIYRVKGCSSIRVGFGARHEHYDFSF